MLHDTQSADHDGLDLAILRLLSLDARRSFGDIGASVGLSAPAVKRRIDRLHASGVIRGYTTVVDHAKLGYALEAFTEVKFSGDTRVDSIANVGGDIPEVEAVFTLAGDSDALVWIRVRDVHHLKHVVDQIRGKGNVTGTKTMMVLGTSKNAAWEAGRDNLP